MRSECLGCGASLDDQATSCAECLMSVPLKGSDAARPRKRLSIPFATVVAMGFAFAVMIGGGKPGAAHPAGANAAVGASIDGKPVQIGGPAIAMLERRLGSGSLQSRRSAGGPTKPAE